MDYEAKRIYHEGMEEGRQEGRLEGRIQERIDIYRNEDRLSDEEIIRRIMTRFDLSEEAAKEYVLAPALV